MHEDLIQDLKRSGLEASDLHARDPGPPELAATGTALSIIRECPGYVIPYADIEGNPTPFYRIKLLNHDPKYKQVRKCSNYIYFPYNFLGTIKQDGFVIITEGEKKAAAAVKNGIPTVGLGGVDSWRNRTILLPEDTEIDQLYGGKGIRARIPSGANSAVQVDEKSVLAIGFSALIDLAVAKNLTFILIFDTDSDGLKIEVQRAMARLGYELKYHGIGFQHIKHLVLPSKIGAKVGLDDFIVAEGIEALHKLINDCLEKSSAFPRHPDPKAFINKCLQKGKLTRREAQELALSVLVELDSRGNRLKEASSEESFYFDATAHKLMPVALLRNREAPLHETLFGAFIYREYGVAAVDSKVVAWLAAQMTGEQGISTVHTHKVLARPKQDADCINYQISDSQYVRITGDKDNPIQVLYNGDDGLLFEQDKVGEIDGEALIQEFNKQLQQPLKFHWHDVLKTLNFKDDYANLTLAALLYYVSPWLHRWRGLQLPVEIVIGEAGSGKSSLYGLRQSILTGAPSLANLTNDIKDWYAGIAATGGLHVLDNVHFTAASKDYRQRISDELCRLTTEPLPHIEMRQLYSNAKVLNLPVTATFAITAIEQPFFAADIIQRSAIFELKAIGDNHNAYWAQDQINRAGGRIGWLAHHLVVLHKFLHSVQTDWNTEYKAAHRLANFEQCLGIVAKLFDVDYSEISKAIVAETVAHISEADLAIQGLNEYIRLLKKNHPTTYAGMRFSCSDIVQWAQAHEDFCSNPQLINSRRLGRYIIAHAETIRRATGLAMAGTSNNKKVYKIVSK